MQTTGSASNVMPRSSSAGHTSSGRAGETADEDITEIFIPSIEEDLRGKEVSVFLFGPRK